MDRITANREILGGKPIIKGTRISVEFILDLLASGVAEKEILRDYPQLTKDDIPPKYRDDGLHIAIATVHRIDVLVSWNLKHMVKWKTRREVKAVNLFEGYGEIEICTPLEVIEND